MRRRGSPALIRAALTSRRCWSSRRCSRSCSRRWTRRLLWTPRWRIKKYILRELGVDGRGTTCWLGSRVWRKLFASGEVAVAICLLTNYLFLSPQITSCHHHGDACLEHGMPCLGQACACVCPSPQEKLGKDLRYRTFGGNPFFPCFCPLFDGPSPPFEGSSRKISQNGAPAKSYSTKNTLHTIPNIPTGKCR
jgi:hypothetical protein